MTWCLTALFLGRLYASTKTDGVGCALTVGVACAHMHWSAIGVVLGETLNIPVK